MATNVAASVFIRDSKDPDGGLLVCSPAEWSTLLAAAKGGRLVR